MLSTPVLFPTFNTVIAASTSSLVKGVIILHGIILSISISLSLLNILEKNLVITSTCLFICYLGCVSSFFVFGGISRLGTFSWSHLCISLCLLLFWLSLVFLAPSNLYVFSKALFRLFNALLPLSSLVLFSSSLNCLCSFDDAMMFSFPIFLVLFILPTTFTAAYRHVFTILFHFFCTHLDFSLPSFNLSDTSFRDFFASSFRRRMFSLVSAFSFSSYIIVCLTLLLLTYDR